jgi:hypothetical protein
VVTDTDVTKGLEYRVVTTPTEITKGLTYVISDKRFTRESGTLKTDETELTTPYSTQDYADVDTNNAVRVAMEGPNAEAQTHLFRFRNDNSTDDITITADVQATVAPSDKTVHLEIWNDNTSSWESLDTDSSTAADTDFTLTGSITSSHSDYYLTGNHIYARVRQST